MTSRPTAETSTTSDSRRQSNCQWLQRRPIQFLLFYIVILATHFQWRGNLQFPWHMREGRDVYQSLSTHQNHESDSATRDRAGSRQSMNIQQHQRSLCQFRSEAGRTTLVHMHIPKCSGTALAVALSSECRCKDAPRPGLAYCNDCPHVLPDPNLPVTTLRQNLWTVENKSFSPPYSQDCKGYKASSRWYGFPNLHEKRTFYSQNRLTSGWPCGVHAGYARMRMCFHRFQLHGIKHVVVTLFRDPVARLVSEFYQTANRRRTISAWDWCMRRIPPLSLTEFIGLPISYPLQSRMTKLLSGSAVQTSAAGEDWKIPGVKKKALRRALKVLRSDEDFLFGLTEEFELSLEMFRFVFRRSLEAPSCHSHYNSTDGDCKKVQLRPHSKDGKPFKLTKQQKHLFDKNNREDKILYRHAKRLFYERIEAMRALQSLGSDAAIDSTCSKMLE